MSGRQLLFLVRPLAPVLPADPAGRKALNWANRPPFGQPRACRDGIGKAGHGAVNGWPASERRPRPAAVGVFPAIFRAAKLAWIAIPDGQLSPAIPRAVLTRHAIARGYGEGQPGRRRRAGTPGRRWNRPVGQSAPIPVPPASLSAPKPSLLVS